MLLGPSSVVSAYRDDDESDDGASAADDDVVAGGLPPPALLLIAFGVVAVVVVVVDIVAVIGVSVDAAVCGVAMGDLSEPSETDTALVPPQPHMKPRAFFLMRSPPAAPRRRDIRTFMERAGPPSELLI
jgi:hypothetical protein